MKKLGVIGGLGPMATAFFMQLVIEMTEASTDQEHIEMIIYNCPAIPDRTKYILGESKESPVNQMIAVGKQLVKNGADLVAIPCITANYFYKEIQEAISVPVINVVDEIVKELQKEGITKVGIMATDGVLQSGLFQQALDEVGIQVILPDEKEQRQVMHLIYENIKAGKAPNEEYFLQVSKSLQDKGAQIIVLGCSELSMVPREGIRGISYLDGMQLLAKCSVETCGKLKKEYGNDK